MAENKLMKYIDRIYGDVEIKEPVILDLLQCSTLQRLKKIDQYGYLHVYYPTAKHDRFEHTVGVYLLLKKYGAPFEEQVAGLIHDVSHSAFSHCIDYVLEEGSETEHSHQDNSFASYVKNSEIPEILQRHGFDVAYILEDKHFPLKETDLPDLCADRIDYILRTAVVCDRMELQTITGVLDKLRTHEQKWVFSNYESAKFFAQMFDRLSRKYYCHIESALMFRTVGDVLKHALEQGYISKDDLYTTDEQVLMKITSQIKTDERLQYLYKRMNNEISYKKDPDDFEVRVSCKSRIVDPWCYHQGALQRVSDVDPLWKEVVKSELMPKEYYIRFLD